ncbi:MAG: hypothetical protein ACRCST_14785 [Turicibacter sp.]
MKKLITWGLAILLGSTFSYQAQAAQVTSGNNLFLFDHTISSEINVLGDVYAFGNLINLTGNTGGDILSFGSVIHVQSDGIGGNIRAAGNEITLNAGTVKNITVAGQHIIIEQQTQADAIYVAGDDIQILGTANEVNVAGNTVFIDGEIFGDVDISCRELTLGENAKIHGTIEVEAKQEPRVLGNVEASQIEYKYLDNDHHFKWNVGFININPFFSRVYSFASAIGLTLLMVLLGKPYLTRIQIQLVEKAYVPFLVGFGVLIGLPIASILLMITVIGIPFSLLGLFIYGILIYMAPVIFGITLGTLVIKDQNPYLVACIGTLVLKIIISLPFMGWIVGLAAILFSLGSFVCSFSHRK